MKTIITDKITIGDVKKWIAKCKCISSLQMIRAKSNKRIKYLISPREESPFKHIPVKEKRKVLESLFVKGKK